MVNMIKNNNMEAVVNSKYAVVDFSATWCGPCKMVAPVVDELSEELAGEVDFFNCDVDDNSSLASQFRIMSVPSIVIFKDGKAVDMKVGFQPKEQLKAFILGHK